MEELKNKAKIKIDQHIIVMEKDAENPDGRGL